jgi:hypothetical protein
VAEWVVLSELVALVVALLEVVAAWVVPAEVAPEPEVGLELALKLVLLAAVPLLELVLLPGPAVEGVPVAFELQAAATRPKANEARLRAGRGHMMNDLARGATGANLPKLGFPKQLARSS